jgi:hypothetical protein
MGDRIMKFIKDNDVYKVARITGVQDNILGISFAETNSNVQIIEWKNKKKLVHKTSPEEVLKQVEDGLRDINRELGTNYSVSKIYFLPSDSPSNSVYKYLITEIVKRVDNKEEFVIV